MPCGCRHGSISTSSFSEIAWAQKSVAWWELVYGLCLVKDSMGLGEPRLAFQERILLLHDFIFLPRCSKVCRCHWNILEMKWTFFEDIPLRTSTLLTLRKEVPFCFPDSDSLPGLRFKPRGPCCHHVQITSLGGWDRSVSRRKLHVGSCCTWISSN